MLETAEHYLIKKGRRNVSEAVITRKGQVTIPIEIRRSLGLNRGDRVTFVEENGTARLMKAKSVVEQTAGMLSKYRLDHAPTDDEFNEAIELAIAEDAMRADAT